MSTVALVVDFISAVVGVLISLLTAYLPGYSGWFASLDGIKKRLFMLGLITATALVVGGLSCTSLAELLPFPLTCDQPGWLLVGQAWFACMFANQGTFLLTTASSNSRKIKSKL